MVIPAWLAATWGLEPQVYAGEHGSDAALTEANYRKGKAFFFEKKKQKTFASLSRTYGQHPQK